MPLYAKPYLPLDVGLILPPCFEQADSPCKIDDRPWYVCVVFSDKADTNLKDVTAFSFDSLCKICLDPSYPIYIFKP